MSEGHEYSVGHNTELDLSGDAEREDHEHLRADETILLPQQRNQSEKSIRTRPSWELKITLVFIFMAVLLLIAYPYVAITSAP